MPATTAPAHTNRLANQTSPYLLQHAHNPVDWHPWGPEAFEIARREDKPIFLSVGYSTCYWCHVMERESFENEMTAGLMNKHFVCIKVDREERPDVDDIYMTAVQLMTQSGGWPMSVFLEPHGLKPFFAGTYFPPRDAFGRPSFQTVLRQMADTWATRRAEVDQQADVLAEAITAHLGASRQPVAVGAAEVNNAIATLMSGYDKIDGGFVGAGGRQRAPKFPTPVNLEFLMGAAWNQKDVRDAVLHTLDRMAIGGMYDQVGGGFHRYSVDEKWLVPHFEKMLYDQGQLASVYAKAHELTRDSFYAKTLRRTLDYVIRELTSTDGAFLSAQDAEVDAREGKNYLWTADEVRAALDAAGLGADVDLALKAYGLDGGTNFQDPHHPQEPASNVLFLSQRPDNLSVELGVSTGELEAKLDAINAAMLKAREARPQPGTDDKVLAGWNGLMIAGMADGGRVLKDKTYVDAAAKAARFVLSSMRATDGALLRSYRGQASIPAYLDDHACMIRGLLALHRATGDRQWLNDARTLAQAARARFWDESAGGFFDTLADQADLFVRVKGTYDGAVPSGNGVMLLNLLDLHEATGQASFLDDAAATMRFVSATLQEQPTGCVLSTLALHRMVQEHPTRLDKPKAAAQASPDKAAGPKPSGPSPTANRPVVASVSPVEVQVKPGAPGKMTVTLTIYRGYHVNSNAPGDEFLIPLKIELTGAQGLQLTADYPKGDAFTAGEISAGTIYVHEGTVAIPLTLEQTGKVSGTPRLSVTWQACTHKECLEPKTETLGLRVIAER